MGRLILHIATAVMFACIGYLIGGRSTFCYTAKGWNLSSLKTLTNIHELITKEDYKAAKVIAENDIDANLHFLAEVDRDPTFGISWILPWSPDAVKVTSSTILKAANDYFIENTQLLNRESREYLASTQERKLSASKSF